MSGFTYEDIFATKGMEYLLVLAFLVVFIFFIRALVSDRGGNDNRSVGHHK